MCWFVASTGVMELLLNKLHNIHEPLPGGPFDLSESFIRWQPGYHDPKNPSRHFIEEIVQMFNHGEAVHNKDWPFNAYKEDGSTNMDVWNRHPDFANLPRISVPKVKTELLFHRGRNRYSTRVLKPSDLEVVKETLFKRKSPIIFNYNDDYFWHVAIIVGYDEDLKGDCYQIEADECNPRGAFWVRDSNGKRFEARAYNWFLIKANAASVVELK